MTTLQLSAYILQLYSMCAVPFRSWTVAKEHLPLLSEIVTVDDLPRIHLDNFPGAVGILFERPVYVEEHPDIVISLRVNGGIGFIDNRNRYYVSWTN